MLHKGMAMPCYQAASFPRRPILPVSLNTYTNLMGKITDSTISQRASPSAPAISRNQKDKREQEWGKKKIKINVQALAAAGFLSPPAQAVCSLLTKLITQGSGRLLLLDIKISKSQKCPSFAIHWACITTTLLFQLLLIRIFTITRWEFCSNSAKFLANQN